MQRDSRGVKGLQSAVIFESTPVSFSMTFGIDAVLNTW